VQRDHRLRPRRDSTQDGRASSSHARADHRRVCQESHANELPTKDTQMSSTLTPAAISAAPR
jgi:hypothetical protein